ncbi:MAG TPA: hypothetical protein VFJ70_20755 [Burkholderiales bacterium]|nr:hypothetical protein [Burkholderiales bacterium]
MKKLAIALAVAALAACAELELKADPAAGTSSQAGSPRPSWLRDARHDYPYSPPWGL